MKIIFQTQTKISPPIQKTDYIVGTNLLANLHKISSIKEKNYSNFLILADKTVFNLYGKKVVSSLKKLNKPVITSIIPPGEASKNLKNIPKFITPFFKHGFDRKSVLVSLGGGVITDIGGFLASILMRGISSIYIPTTLSGQIDASVGGKTGVDFWLSKNTMYKNMLGRIEQPQVVISDVDTLKTLPKKEIKNGLGEMVKYWVGWGRQDVIPNLFRNPTEILKQVQDDKELSILISTCQKIKIDIIQKDPLDTLGIREKLNLGHTIGHAVEGAAEGKLSHGEAVSIGLIAAAKISVLKKFLKPEVCRLIIKTVTKLDLPTTVSVSMFRNIRTNSRTKKNLLKIISSAIKMDKKGGSFVLIRDIGKIETGVLVEEKIINKVLKEIIL